MKNDVRWIFHFLTLQLIFSGSDAVANERVASFHSVRAQIPPQIVHFQNNLLEIEFIRRKGEV